MSKRKINFKMIIAAMTAAASLFCFTACGSDSSSGNSNGGKSSGKKIVCTIFPEYDWVKQITSGCEGGPEISCLLENGTDLHSYQPTADDLMKISSCDMLIYVGGESDTWVTDALKNASNKNMKVISLLDVIGEDAKEEEVKEGMQAEDEHEHDEDEEEPEYDEHVWLSLRNAKKICTKLTDELCAMDPDRAENYKSGYAAYAEKLDALDGDYKTLISQASSKTLIFGDRFPFRYFVDDYGLDYYAAFVGCSAETEASFKTVTYLAEKVKNLKPKAIYTIESSDGKIAGSILESSGYKDCKICVLNSLQSVTKAQIDAGESYLDIMRKNYEVLKENL